MISKAQATWLEGYRGDSGFYQSLRDQWMSRAYLSPRQVECVERAMNPVTTPVKPVIGYSSSYSSGDVLIVGKWMARKVAENAGYTDRKAYHAIEVIEAHRETEKAVQVTVKLSAQRTTHCGLCGLALTDPVSVDAGIGPICAENVGVSHSRKGLEELRAKLTVTHPFTVWMPKSQIKEHRKVG